MHFTFGSQTAVQEKTMKPWQIVLFGLIFVAIGIGLLVFSFFTIAKYNEKNKTFIETTPKVIGYNYDDEVELINTEFIVNSQTNNILKPSQNSMYKSQEYVIDAYDINIKVNENNTLDITENITAYFNVAKHGIYRTIPLKNTITRLDGTTSSNRTQITNLNVNKNFTTSTSNGNYKIQIGDANYTLTGEQIYVIKYTYNLGKDPLKDKDELYFNIIGPDWDTVIGNVTFTIAMPKDFDTTKLGFSSGTTGSTENSNIKYTINGNTIKGNYDGILNAKEALTIRCELPEGYFVGAGLEFNSNTIIMFVIPLIGLIISILLWFKYGKDDQVIETVEFYPPEGFNSLEVGFLYKGKAEDKDVTSLLIYLANKGYIKVNNPEDIQNSTIIDIQNTLENEKRNNPNSVNIKYYEHLLNEYQNKEEVVDFKKHGIISSTKKLKFVISKLKEYDKDNLYELLFMKGLFEYDNNQVTDAMLYNQFYRTNDKILHNINNKKNTDKIFKKSSRFVKIFIILMIILSWLSITIPSTLAYSAYDEYGLYGKIYLIITFSLFTGIGITLFFYTIICKKSLFEKLMGIIYGLFGLFCFIFMMLPTLSENSIYLIGYFLGVLCILVMIILIRFSTKRTKYGNEILGKIKGFKNFLETAEKDKLEAMVMQYPTYFYDILPFAYVLGVSDKWIKKFETITLQAPDWYYSQTGFNISSFNTFMNSTMTSAQRAMSSSPSSSSGGSSSGGGSSIGGSGGGSSGGGSGGGGGGSW